MTMSTAETYKLKRMKYKAVQISAVDDSYLAGLASVIVTECCWSSTIDFIQQRYVYCVLNIGAIMLSFFSHIPII